MIDPNAKEMTEKIKIIRQQRMDDRVHFLKNQISTFTIGRKYSLDEYKDYEKFCAEYENFFNLECNI